MRGFELSYNEEMNEIHIPVLLSSTIEYLAPKPGESYLDLTAGYGGHADKILEVTQDYNAAVLNDRDQNAIDYLNAKYQKKKPNLLHNDFYSTALQLVENNKKFDIILADFGVSSPQLDKEERGFSFSKPARLDMRMDQSQELDAWRVINKWRESELTDIFTTTELAELIRHKSPFSHTHPATKVFQAVRIVVNDELGEIERTLPLLPKLLNPGGRVGIISFHSLEDRLVKDYFKEASDKGIESELKILTKKPIVADAAELVNNPRARSAKLRVAVKL